MATIGAKSRTIKVDYLARVEGEGALFVKIRGDKVVDVKLRIFEPPRFFEAFLRGRSFAEAPDIAARICGICPVAYQMSAVHAMEDALGVTVGAPLRDLRRLLYCGEWIESHALHIHLLHAPDFLGYEDAIRMAKDHPEAVQRGLSIKKAGNDLVAAIGGREIHPVNVRVGGFYRAPARRELTALAGNLERARLQSIETIRWAGGLPFPPYERDYEFVAMRHPDEYPMNEGRLVSSAGLDIAAREYEDHFEEEHVEHSSALHSTLKGRGAYLVGPMARYHLNHDRLSATAREEASKAGLAPGCRNPFKSILVRAVEMLYACEEALRLIEAYRPPDEPAVPFEPRAGAGFGCTEAPRGILFHRYTLDADGTILDARIVPPTSQNQKSIENDLRLFVERNIAMPGGELTWQCEQAVRNYDPCISCATHFLRLELDRA